MRLQLSLATAANPRSWPILDGTVKPDGIDLIPTVIHPSEMFWRQLKFAGLRHFRNVDVVADDGDRARQRRLGRHPDLHHAQVLPHRDPGAPRPRHRQARRSQGQDASGVPEYQQTAALWTRGVLQHEFGVNQTEMEHWMERVPTHSHGGATGFKPPPGVDDQADPDREEHRLDDGVGRARRHHPLSARAQPGRPLAPSICTIIPTSRRCSPIRSPKACATTARPASSRSTTAW